MSLVSYGSVAGWFTLCSVLAAQPCVSLLHPISALRPSEQARFSRLSFHINNPGGGLE